MLCLTGVSPARTKSSPTQPASVPSESREVQALGNDELVALLTDDIQYQRFASTIASQSGTTKVGMLL